MSSKTSITAIRTIEVRLTGSDSNSFEGLACRYGVVDSYGTTFATGCFRKGGLDAGAYALLWMHDPSRPVGTFTAEDREDGLYIAGRWNDNAAGQEARAAAMSGSATDLSVGFTWYTDGTDTMLIEVARLHEVSQVTSRYGSVPGSALTAVRAAWADDAQRGMVIINQANGAVYTEALDGPAAGEEPTADLPLVESPEAPVGAAQGEPEASGGKGATRSACACGNGCACQGGTPEAEEAELAQRLDSGPRAVIVDVDDTLISNGELNKPVYDYAVSLGAAILLVTGRPADSRDATVAELEALGINYDELHMQDFGSFAQAVEYKAYKAGRLLETYNVILAVDNDGDAREAYRALGIETLDPEDLMGEQSHDSVAVESARRRTRAYAAYLRTLI